MPAFEEEMMMLTIVDGSLQTSSQFKDYVNRGTLLEHYSLLQFYRDTYSGFKLRSSSSGHLNPGSSKRSYYKDDTEASSICRVIRRKGHETKVEFVGAPIPRADDKNKRSLYCATILALLVPWRNISSIQGDSISLEDEFQRFISVASEKDKSTIENMQYYYEASDGARRKRSDSYGTRHMEEDAVEYEGEEDAVEKEAWAEMLVTEDQIEQAIEEPFRPDEQLFAEVAMNIAADVGIFPDDEESHYLGVDSKRWKVARTADSENIVRYNEWADQISKIGAHDAAETLMDNRADIMPAGYDLWPDIEPEAFLRESKKGLELPHLNILNEEQRMAHDIVINHLDAELANRDPPQTLVFVIGQGGTGKSTLLNAITTSFEIRGASHLLAKTAMSGVAASLIGGSTLHSWAGLPTRQYPQGDEWMNRSSKKVKKRRESNMLKPSWLAVDEVGMLTKDTLFYLSQILGAVRTGNGRTDSTIALGAMNVLLMGDFHQFPPVGQRDVALYSSVNPRPSSLLGQNIYEQFETVIELVQQLRIQDTVWMEILDRSRIGRCTLEDLSEIHKLVLTDERCNVPDFSKEPWDQTTLVTPRNSVRSMWNSAKLRQHCRQSGQVLYVVDAEDTAGREHRSLTNIEKLTVAQMDVNETQRLATRLEVAIGMRAMLTHNCATDIGFANGCRGTVVDVVLDAREPSIEMSVESGGIIRLEFPPAMIVFKPDRDFKFETFHGLHPNEIPIFPKEDSFSIGKKKHKIRITRRQLPLTCAYAFTDQKSQGQTLGNVIVDIGKTSRFPVDQFGAYVALSRSRGRHKIRLLREFEEKLFTKHPSEDLRAEDERLQRLVQETKKKWAAGVFNFD